MEIMDRKNVCRGRSLMITVWIMMLALQMAEMVEARTITVNASGGADYAKIQDAINNAKAGDTILVNGGTYYEHVTVNKELILRGVDTGAGNPVVDAGGNGSAITLSADRTMLEGFKATNSGKSQLNDAGIKVTSRNNMIIANNASNNINGIYLYSSNNNILTNNTANWNAFGIYIVYSKNNTFTNYSANRNTNHGIYAPYSDYNSFIEGTLNSNYYYGIYLGGSNNKILGSTINSNPMGIYLESGHSYIVGNTIKDNSFGIFVGCCLDGYNIIFNNSFNNSNNYGLYGTESTSYFNYWSTTKTIIGGPYVSGNFWADPFNTGFSQTCADKNGDWICDSPFVLYSNNIDYMPLAKIPAGGYYPNSSTIETLTSGAMILQDTEGKIVSSAPYSASELKGLSQILIKSGPPGTPLPDNNGIDAIFETIVPRIKTFDGEKYEKIDAKLLLEGGSDQHFDLLYNLKGMRDNRTEFWKFYINLFSAGNRVGITDVSADWTLVPDKYVESGKEIALNGLDENIRIKTPVFTGSKWLPESNGFIVLKYKNNQSSAITDVTLNLNEKKITNIEKHYWGETFSLDIVEFGQANLFLKTDTIYGCYNFKIIANTERSGDRIIVVINGIDREGGYCEAAMGPARYEVNLGELNGTIRLLLKYEGEEDQYKMEISNETFEIIPLASNFTHFEHPLSLLRVPKNVIWIDCGHYNRIGCEENNESASVCQNFFNDLEKLGAEPYKLKNGTYTFKSDLSNKRSFKYTGNITKLENLVRKYSKNTKREIINEGCTLLELRTWRGDWFFSWNSNYENAIEITELNGSEENEKGEQKRIAGFVSVFGIIALVSAARLRRMF